MSEEETYQRQLYNKDGSKAVLLIVTKEGADIIDNGGKLEWHHIRAMLDTKRVLEADFS